MGYDLTELSGRGSLPPGPAIKLRLAEEDIGNLGRKTLRFSIHGAM